MGEAGQKMICKRKIFLVIKNAFWVIISVKLVFLCLLVVGFRNDETRSKIFNSLGPEGDDNNHLNGSSRLAQEQPLLQQQQSSQVSTTASSADDSKNDWKFKNFRLEEWETNQNVQLQEQENTYFKPIRPGSTLLCFTEGTDFTSVQPAAGRCPCLDDYYGADCGIPAAAWHGHFAHSRKGREALKRRRTLRRIVHGVLLNHEFDFFEARVRELQDVVDVYIVQESNFTTFGASKELHFLDRFRDQGWLADQQHKFAYVFLPHFASKGQSNGWFADAYIRKYLSGRGLPLIGGLEDDDLFLMLDADELPTREALLFLKLYDGYTEPVRFGFRWTIFGFFWLKAEDPGIMSMLAPLIGEQKQERLLQLYVACTIGMLKRVYGSNAMLLRRNVWSDKLLKARVHNYTRVEGHAVKEWEMGTIGHYAGFHCSWCYSPEGIRTKLLSAQKDDSPRWGDYPEKTDLGYIRGLVRTGSWFDDTRPFIGVFQKEAGKYYAPRFLMENRERFSYLLEREKDPEEEEEEDGNNNAL